MSLLNTVVGYHDRTKHHVQRYARSLGYMDWDTQPDPFRRYEGARLFILPFGEEDGTPKYGALYQEVMRPAGLTVDRLARFLEMSLAISAWKSIPGTRWSLRCNPSSGNLHPTEGYLVTGAVEGLGETGAVYHYAPLEHGLEERTSFSDEVWRKLSEGFPAGTLFAGLSSIFWRESWKYGERAFRYCQHDAGHAAGALAVAAAAFGWRAVHLDGLGDESVARLLGLDREADFGEAEREHPEMVLAIVPGDWEGQLPVAINGDAMRAVAEGAWHGHANRLSSDHVPWPIIDEVASATAKPETGGAARAWPGARCRREEARGDSGLSVYGIARQRRSAVAMDGETELDREVFYGMMGRVMPETGVVPWDAVGGPPSVHLALFVHRVRGLEPGLYFLARNGAGEETLRRDFRHGFHWRRPEGCPGRLPLYGLDWGDCRRLAAQLSCGQDIAGASAFAVAMIARFRPVLEEEGPWAYRRLFWETGLIGQVLYLEAEAAGVRSTGIGCYFDDPVHQVLGIGDHEWQSLYHFTVGGAVEDERLTTLPPYDEGRLARFGWTKTEG